MRRATWQDWMMQVCPAYNIPNPLPKKLFECMVTIVADTLSQANNDMMLASFQSDTGFSVDALSNLEQEVGLPRYTSQTDEEYIATLQDKWNLWQEAGKAAFIESEITKAIGTQCYTARILYDVPGDMLASTHYPCSVPPSQGGYNDANANGYVQNGVNYGWPSQFEVWIVVQRSLLNGGTPADGYSDLAWASNLQADIANHRPQQQTPPGPYAPGQQFNPILGSQYHWPNHQIKSLLVTDGMINSVRSIIKRFKPANWRCNSIKVMRLSDAWTCYNPLDIPIGATPVTEWGSGLLTYGGLKLKVGVEKFVYNS